MSKFEFYNHLPSDFDLFKGEPLSEEIWRNKYRWGDESDFSATAHRVVKGVYVNDYNAEARLQAYEAMALGLWMPGGRIIAGAGTDKMVTLMNCYVNSTVDDSMRGIHDAFGNIMFTTQQGGGIGTDWSPLRPNGAWLSRTQAPASGPGPFISSADAIGRTVESSGERRAAQMWTLVDTHPDLPTFIKAKQEKGVWTNGNISILVSDAFMNAVLEDEDWFLFHEVPPRVREPNLVDLDFMDEDTNKKMHVYAVWRARELWELITRSTYEYSEPGVIFIDRVNDLNNLQYCETISCTNPCGEQPLPPNGTCNLGAVNTGLMVRKPFTDDAEFDWELLRQTVRVGARFLDNVIEVTNYPLEAQKEEELSKRRIGLGKSALASAMAQLGLRYGSNRSAAFAGEVMRTIAIETYSTSAELAEERGAFPLYDADKFWNGTGFAATKFKDQPFYGAPMRFGVGNTIAPTGTTSTAYGNIESGLEPTFLYDYIRNVVQREGPPKPTQTMSFTARLWRHLNGQAEFPRHFVTANQLAVHEHIAIQEACQNWVDASISKTINLPTEMPYEDFVRVYEIAFEAGLKGCTTYRPSDVRGSILEAVGEKANETAPSRVERPDTISGKTTKIQWPGLNSALYISLNRLPDGTPYEVFFNSKDQRFNEWWTTATLLASWLMRMGVPLQTIADELEQVHSIEGYMVQQRYRPSLVSFIGAKLRDLDIDFQKEVSGAESSETPQLPQPPAKLERANGRCPNCLSPNLRREEGCVKCQDCDYNKCG